MPLRWKTLLYSTTLLLALVAAMLFLVNYQAEQFVNNGITADLEQSRERIKSVEEQRLASLRLTAGLVASFPNLKALLATDVPTIRDFLVTYQQRNLSADLLIVLDSAGRVIARTDTLEPVSLPDVKVRWIGPLLAGQSATGVLDTGNSVYHAAAMPAEAGGTIFGFVIAGARLDNVFARVLRDFSESEVIILGNRVLGSTIPAASLPWQSDQKWKTADGTTGTKRPINIGGENYVAMTTGLDAKAKMWPLVVMLKSHDRAVEPYRRIRTGLLLLLLLATLAAIMGSAVLAHTLTAPIAKLVEGTRKVAAGNLDFRLDIDRRDEIGLLAQSFNTMIGERKRLEEQFRQSQKMEAIGRLAGAVAHDFNNLLTAITGYGQMVLSRLNTDDPLHSDVAEILKAADRGSTLTRQLLTFSRRQVVVPKMLDLNFVVRDMEKLLRRLIRANIQLVTTLDPALGQVKADPGQIEQILLNLVVNAADAMPEGGKLTLETANVSTDGSSQGLFGLGPGRYVILAVKDTGTGMNEEVRSHLFEPFFTTKEKGKGTGLGLATVYGIVQQSNGHIKVESELGRGSTFIIYLPRLDQTVETAEGRKTCNEESGGWETVLVVEDEPAPRELARRALEAKGYKVLEASSGKEAMALCAQHTGPLHLMITDIVMPEMSGPQLAEQIALLRPNTKVLFMSGYTDSVGHGKATIASAFLKKPFTADSLGQKVREILDVMPEEKV
ncbi:MAG: response regulator [Acidobacteria bacterium]|nr:response regulator [Acidobacteriota bacterium]